MKTCECTITFQPQLAGGETTRLEASVHTVRLMPASGGNVDQLVVVNNTNVVFITTLQGQILRSMTSGRATGGDFIAATLSSRVRDWI